MLADLRTGLPRALRRHRALLAGGLATAAVLTALPQVAPAAGPTIRMLAAAHELAPGVPLVAADLRVIGLPAALIPAGALTERTAVLGQVLAGPVRAGEPLTDARLVSSRLLPRSGDLVAVPVRLADAAEAGLLHAGDYIDVLATPSTGAPAASVVGSGLRVLSVPTAANPATGDTALIVLAASRPVAARLAGSAAGSRLSVTLLAPP